jgi:hypothetical protein
MIKSTLTFEQQKELYEQIKDMVHKSWEEVKTNPLRSSATVSNHDDVAISTKTEEKK